MALSRVLREGDGSSRIDVVFDVYRDLSIKSVERELRSEEDFITFKNVSSGQKVKQFRSFSHQTASNILSKFLQNGTVAAGKPGWKERTVATPNVVEFVEYSKVFTSREETVC